MTLYIRTILGVALLFAVVATPVTATSAPQQGCATLSFDTTAVAAAEGDFITLQVLLDADSVTFDVVGFLINFDASLLQVVDAVGDPTSTIAPGDLPGVNVINAADNTNGTIEFSQAIIGGQTGGTFTVATIRFQVVAGLLAEGTQLAFVGTDSGDTGVFSAGINLLCASPEPATVTACYDFQQPGGVGTEDVDIVANLWRQAAEAPHDCDGDGKITVRDVMCVIAHWDEACP